MSLDASSGHASTPIQPNLEDTNLHKEASRLVSLPAELRIAIWEFAVSPGDCRDKDGAVDLLTATPPDGALLLTCHGIYDETQSIYSQARYRSSTQFYLNVDDPDCTYDNIERLNDTMIGQINHLSIKSKVPCTNIFNNGFWRSSGSAATRCFPQGSVLAAESLLAPVHTDDDGDEDYPLVEVEFEIDRRLHLPDGVWETMRGEFRGYNIGFIDMMPADISVEDAAWVKEKVGWLKLSKREIVGMLYWYRQDLKEAGLS